MHNFKLQKPTILKNYWWHSYWFLISKNFASMDDIRRKYNPMVDLSKFTSNKKTLSKVVAYGYNQYCS